MEYTPFLAARVDDPFPSATILGCPYEAPSAFRKGASAAPTAIRAYSAWISTYHPRWKKDLGDLSFSDIGDMCTADRGEDAVFSELERTAVGILRQKSFLLTLGGTRAISYPLIKAARQVYPHLRVISLDAHSGREKRGKCVGHDDLFSALLEDTLREKDLYQWGLRVGSREALEAAGMRNFTIPPKVKKEAMEHLHRLCKYPVYLTVDMDVMDPPFAPGSGHPVYGGIDTAELLDTVALLRGLNVVGMDITEIIPACDPAGITTMLGTALVKEALLCFAHKRR